MPWTLTSLDDVYSNDSILYAIWSKFTACLVTLLASTPLSRIPFSCVLFMVRVCRYCERSSILSAPISVDAIHTRHEQLNDGSCTDSIKRWSRLTASINRLLPLQWTWPCAPDLDAGLQRCHS